MIINKETIKEFLEGVLEWCHDDFDKFEADHEFEFEDRYVGTCESVSTESFRVTINNFEIEMINEKVVCINGTGNASYDVEGSFWDGDWDDVGGYKECVNDEGNADFLFTIWPEGDELNEDVSISII